MPKTEYTLDDHIRALLRSAIATTNNRLEKILNQYLSGSVVLRGSGGSLCLDTQISHLPQVFDKTYACLNENFFFSKQNDESATFIAHLYAILSKGHKAYEQLLDHTRNAGPSVAIDPVLRKIILTHGEKNAKEYREYIATHMGQGVSREDLMSKAERAQTKLTGADYEDELLKAGYSGRKLEQAKLFLDVIGKQYSQSRVIDFLDTYTLYHYYVFRDTINKRFTDYCDQNPNADLRNRQIMFEKIVQEEVVKHCASPAGVCNAYFDRSKMSLSSRRIDNKRAKSLSLDIMDGSEGSKRLLIAKLQSIINESTPYDVPIDIINIEFRPRPKTPIKGLRPEERRKVLEGSKLLTTINCGMIYNSKYVSIIDNDFYSDVMSAGQYQKPPAKPATPSKNAQQKTIEEARRQQEEEAKKYQGEQLKLF